MDTPRAAYRHSGKVDWVKFLPGLLVTAGAAIVMALCLFWALNQGFYLIIIAPLAASFPIIGMWYLVLTWSHCRNRSVATMTSLLLALLLYLGYYQIGMIETVGVQNAHRIDLLPRYVQFRMKTDVARDVGRPVVKQVRRQEPGLFQEAINWFCFGSELLIVIGLFVAVGQRRTAKAFCEPCGRWMESEVLTLPPGIGVALWESLQAGNFDDVQERLASTSRESGIGCTLTLEHCPSCPDDDRSSAAYLTLADVSTPQNPVALGPLAGSRFDLTKALNVRTLVDHAKLHPTEVGVLAASFPRLKNRIEGHPKLFSTELLAAHDIERARATDVSECNGRVAQVKAVDPRDAGTVLTRRNAIIQTVIRVASICGGFALALAPAGVILNLEPRPPDWVAGVLVCWMITGLVLSRLWVQFFSTYLTARFMSRQTWQAIECRADPAIDLHNPDLYFVDIVPRINWGKKMMETASDIGFLELNRARRELIFEGDSERYWIPVESILEIKHEFWAEVPPHQPQSTPTLHHLVVVRATTAEGPWETWFQRRHNKFQMRTAKRRLADALELENKIHELMEPASGTAFSA